MDNRHDRVDKQQERNPSAAELQRRLQDTRQSLTHTVEEMKTTMNTQYHQVKDRATQSLDWKLQMQKYPIAACLGALAVGFLAGRTLGESVGDDDDDYMIDHREHEHDFTSMHGSSRVPSTARGLTEKILPPQTRARMASRVEDVLGNLTEQFLGEITRVGRDVVVPGLIGALTSRLSGSGSSSSTSHFDTSQQNVGGTGTFGSQSGQGPSYQGRSL
ncbi:MAG: hypothetical protein ACR2IE_15125 [Candidatus Sumerlaeaceae bacterium]